MKAKRAFDDFQQTFRALKILTKPIKAVIISVKIPTLYEEKGQKAHVDQTEF